MRQQSPSADERALQLERLFRQLKPLAINAVQNAHLISSGTSPGLGAKDAVKLGADVAGRSFFDRKGDELSEDMRKKRAKALQKLQKQEEKRRRAASTSKVSVVDLDALFADQVVQLNPQVGATTSTSGGNGERETSSCVSPQPAIASVTSSRSRNTSESESGEVDIDVSLEECARNGSVSRDAMGTASHSAAGHSHTSAAARTTTSYLRLTPSRYLFASQDLDALHAALVSLVDLTHPTALSEPGAPSLILQALRRIVRELPGDAEAKGNGDVHETSGRSGEHEDVPALEMAAVARARDDAHSEVGPTTFEHALRALQPLVLDDITTAMYVMALMANLSTMPDPVLRRGLPVCAMWGTTLIAAQRYKSAKRTLHFILTVLSNLAFAGRYITPVQTVSERETLPDSPPLPPPPPVSRSILTPSDCALLVELGVPYYTEAAVVEAWFAMLTNVVAVHCDTIPCFIDLGLVAVVEQLLIYHGRQPRVVLHGFQLLTSLSTAVTMASDQPKAPISTESAPVEAAERTPTT